MQGKTLDSVGDRWVALDRLRALAVLLMIQGHAFFALLDPAEQEGAWYRVHKLFHGMTAPMFLMGAGLAFGLTTYPHWDKFRYGGRAHHARLRRYLVIAALGYVLQLPGMSLGQAWNSSPEAWTRIVRVGPLQLIGVSLFLTQLTTRLTRKPALHAACAGLLAVAVTAVAPLAWNVETRSVASPGVMAWLSGNTGSQFPAFPWAAYLLGGMTLASASLWPETGRMLRSGYAWAGLGAIACGVTYTLYAQGFNPYGEHDFWRSSPLYTIFRGGGVALWLALCSLWAGRQRGLDRHLAVLARHSLLAYVAHLILLYGAYPLPGLVHLFEKRSMPLGSAVLVSLALIGATILVITAWRRALRAPRLADYTRYSLAAACLFMLLR